MARTLGYPALLGVLGLAAAALAAQAAPVQVFLALGALLLFTAAFLRAEWGLYILVFSMLLSPEFVVGETAGGSLGRGVTLRADDFLLVLIGLSWLARTAVIKDLGLFLRTPLNKPIFFYMVSCVASTLLGVMAGRVEPKTGGLFVLKYLEYFIVYFMVANHVRERPQAVRLLASLLLTAGIVSLSGWFQIPGGGRVSAPFEGGSEEPNTFGGYLLFVGMVAAGMAAKIREPEKRNLLLLLLAIMLPPFVFTQSRSSYLAAVPALLVLGVLTERRLVALGLIAIGLLFSPLFMPEVAKQRILYTFNQPEEPGQVKIGDIRLDTSTSARLQSWKQALRDFTRHPLLGHGVTGYAFVDAQIPRVLAETGLLGLAAFLFLVASVFRIARRRLAEAGDDPLFRGLLMGFIAGLVGLLVHALGTNTFILVRVMEPFWFATGLVAVLPALRK
ncbi:MAG: O-antigen ligase family protein [Desulfobacterales bacterium]